MPSNGERKRPSQRAERDLGMTGARETGGWGVEADSGRRARRQSPFFMALSMSRSSSLAWLFWGSVCSSPRTYFRAFSYSCPQGKHTPCLSTLLLRQPIRGAPPCPPPSSPTQWSRVHKQPQLCGGDKPGEITTQALGQHPNPDVTLFPTPSAPRSCCLP